MTLYWDILESGDLAVWYWAQDPNNDTPLATQSHDGDGWGWNPDSDAGRDFPADVFDLLFQVAQDYVADNGFDENYARFSLEVACEQIERR